MRVKLSFSKVRKVILGLILFIGVFSGGYYFGVQGYKAELNNALQVKINRQVPPDKNVDFSLFWQVWDTLSAKYYDKSKLVPTQMVYGAIEGMVSALGDPYSMFLPPTQNKVVNEDLSGSFEGVGIEIGYKNTHLAVISPLPGSPSEKAGVKAGDYIVHIKDEKKGLDLDAQNLNLAEAVGDIRGPAGTKVTLTLIRDGNASPIVVDIIRAKLDVPSVTLTYVGKDKNIADIKVSRFGSETPGEWDKAVNEIVGKSEVKNIIIDLRNNPGGYLQAAVDLAGDFVKNGTTVVIQQEATSKTEIKSDRLGRLQNYKVVILINGGSASASEILAGALRDDRGVKLVGEKSFGKGTIQEPIDIAGGSGLHVTTAKWLTPNGTWVHGVGLTPDVVITPKDSDKDDVILQGAVKLLE
ncbi:MAG TPA: S41 family peptidase [Patescibacteria group bacterium]|nr:S41 family peptidase [Patescibacteria group bacterium]